MGQSGDIKNVGVWVRVSHENQVLADSPLHHETRARKYAEFKEWNVVEVYRLDAVSGGTIIDHPTTKRMIADIQSGKISGLIFSKLARLGRNTRELLEIAELFKTAGADLISLGESIDTTTAAGQLLFTVIAALTQFERDELSARVKASVPIRAGLGKPTGGAAPFGYQWQNKRLIPHPTEAPVRVMVHKLFLTHKRKSTVAGILNEQGLRTRNGSLWSDTTVERLLRDTTVKGLRRANYSESLGKGKAWKMKPESEWVWVEVEPLITADEYDAITRILDEQAAGTKRVGRRPAHLFTGLIYCHCASERRMYVPSNSKKYVCATCRNRIGITDIEDIFLAEHHAHFTSPTNVSAYFDKAKSLITEKEAQLASLRDEGTRLEKEMTKTHRAYLDEKLNADAFGSLYNPMHERKAQLDREVPEREAELDFIRSQLLSADTAAEEGKTLHHYWQHLTDEEKRRVLESQVERVTVGEDEVHFSLRGIPSLPSGNAPYIPHNPTVAGNTYQTTAWITPAWGPLILKVHTSLLRGLVDAPRTIGDHIKSKRLVLRLHQAQVADLLGVSEAAIWLWEHGRTTPRPDQLRRIIEWLGFAPWEGPPQHFGASIRRAREWMGR